MTSQIWGGGVIFALVVLLWVVCLIPGMRRQRQYRATVRNADRLQRTLRVLSEGAGAPAQVTVDPNPAEIAEQKRILREAELREGTSRRARRAAAAAAWRERRAQARAARATAEQNKVEERRKMRERELQERVDAATDPVLAAHLRARSVARARRRARLGATAILLLSIPVMGAGVAAAVAGSGAGLLVLGLIAGASAVAALVRMAVVAERAAQRGVQGVPVVVEDAAAQPLYDQDSGLVAEPRVASHRPLWDSEPMPEALQNTEGSLAAETLARAEAQEQLRQAALAQVMAEIADSRQAESVQEFAAAEIARLEQREAERVAREAEAARATAEAEQRAADAANPFAAMGRVGEYDPTTDVSDILRRRRNAG
ncbi:MAG: hypothetical protein ACTJHU_07585 [Mycetocola sp.]